VRHGDPLAVVMTTDPSLLEAQLAVIQAEVDLLRYSLDPLIGRQRSDLDYERLRVELMSQRAAQATAEVRRLHAENDLARARQLYADDLIAIAELEQAITDHEALVTEIAGHRAIVSMLQDELERLNLPSAAGAEETLLAAIRVHEQRLRVVEAELAPVTLRAPLDGRVGLILRGAGEHVMAGEPLLTVMSETTDHVIAYLRQPLRVEPTVGMAVRVTAPARDRGAGLGRVLQVSAQLEPLPELLLAPGMRPEKALPLLISLPEGMRVRPGERLELSLLP
jgi:multidrug resistance efflux pump